MAISKDTLLDIAEQKRMARINFAETMYNLDMAQIAAITGSALEQLAYLGKATEDSAEPGLVLPPNYTDALDLIPPPIGFPLQGTIEVLPGIDHPLYFIDLGMNNVSSSQVSAFAADTKGYTDEMTIGGPRDVTRLIIRFKGGGHYRYLPLTHKNFTEMVAITQEMAQGTGHNSLTIGEYVNRVVKQQHEIGKCICEKFDPATNSWIPVLTKAQRDFVKANPDQGEAVHLQVQSVALAVHREIGDTVEADKGIPMTASDSGTDDTQDEAQMPEQSVENQGQGTEGEGARPVEHAPTEVFEEVGQGEPVAPSDVPAPVAQATESKTSSLPEF
jgi:hypothetical protein